MLFTLGELKIKYFLCFQPARQTHVFDGVLGARILMTRRERSTSGR